MGKVRKLPINRCFGGQCPPNPEQHKREQQVKEVLLTKLQRRGANKVISHLAERFGCSLVKLLKAVGMQVEKGNLSPYVLDVLIERIEGQRRRNELSDQEITDLEIFKLSRRQP